MQRAVLAEQELRIAAEHEVDRARTRRLMHQLDGRLGSPGRPEASHQPV